MFNNESLSIQLVIVCYWKTKKKENKDKIRNNKAKIKKEKKELTEENKNRKKKRKTITFNIHFLNF